MRMDRASVSEQKLLLQADSAISCQNKPILLDKEQVSVSLPNYFSKDS